MSPLLSSPITYIARDIERALGVPEDTEGYHIISNSSTFAKIVSKHRTVTLIHGEHTLSTQELLAQADVTTKSVIVFKNTGAIERLATEKNLQLLNPSAALANSVEEKISQLDWLHELVSFLPEHSIRACKELTYDGVPYIIQFNHAHSGEGTRYIESAESLKDVREKFPNRPVRVTSFVEGAVYTVNAVVHAGGVLVSSPSYQITGVAPFTDHAFTTVGNDWGLAHRLLSEEQQATIAKMASSIGKKLQHDGWKGLFGIDIVVEASTGTVYLIEINARQPASTTYESQLQQRAVSDTEITTFEAHLRSLLSEDLSGVSLVSLDSGSQIVQRMTNDITTYHTETLAALKQCDLNVIPYDEKKLGAELIRIQSETSIMKAHSILSPLGEQISQILAQ